jgi:hypothetical protein
MYASKMCKELHFRMARSPQASISTSVRFGKGLAISEYGEAEL